MNDIFIESCHVLLEYEKKEGTKGSFYLKNGIKKELPERISWGIFAQRKHSKNDNLKKNEINGIYKKNEEGIYYSLDKRKIHSSIWGDPEFPEFYGYGIIDERFSIYDLLIIHSGNNCSSTFDIHLFKGMGKPEYMKKAFSWLRDYMNKKPH